MGEISWDDTSSIEDDSPGWWKELTLVKPYPEEASLEKCCGDVVMVRDTPSIGHTDSICIEPFDSMPISSLLLPTISSHACIP